MQKHDPDAGLIERIGRGDAAATRLLVAAKLPQIVGLANRILRDRGEAEDVAQEAFMRTWRAAARWEPGRALFNTWLHSVVLNLCRDRLRRTRHIAGDALPNLADPSPGAEEALIETERSRSVADAIAALPERQREAILLVHYQNLSGAEAAKALDISAEALESLLARARRALRARLTRPQEGDAHD